jgi:hypothetical protein
LTRLAEGFTGSVKAAVVHEVSHQGHRLFKSSHGITSPWIEFHSVIDGYFKGP